MRPSTILSLLFMVLALPVNAGSNVVAAAAAAAAEAAKRPRIAAVLASRERLDAATIARDMAAIEAALAPDIILNGPNNRMNDRASIIANIAAGRVDHGSLERTIEYVSERGNDVILTGKETTKPRTGEPGKIAHRRFTDIWTETPQGWKIVLRQATIYATE
jgi:ketosteroid isomerase-like protein